MVATVVILAAAAGAQVDPVVSNVNAQQRVGTELVDITYDLDFADNDTVAAVEVYFSSDGGLNFDRKCRLVTGDVGALVPTGPGRAIVWDAGFEVPEQRFMDGRIRVVAYDAVPPPTITHLRIGVDGADTTVLAPGVVDTVAFGEAFRVGWWGRASAVAFLDTVFLVMADTIYPFDDALLGHKWRLLGELGGNCIPTLEDCWRPRRFDPATGDSVSYWSMVNGLIFANSDPLSSNPLEMLLPSGVVPLRVDALDIYGGQVPEFYQERDIVVNRDPETRILDGEAHADDPNGDDTQVYPYYVRLNDPLQTKVPFASGAHIPDRTYVVVKALGRDDSRDLILDPGYGVGMQGFVQGRRFHLDGGQFSFQTEASELDTGLGQPDPAGWQADTLGFIVGPRTTYDFHMRAVDEHGRRDGTPASVRFHVGQPPCVQCIEVLPKSYFPSNFPDPELACSPDPGNACLDGSVTDLDVSVNGTGSTDLEYVRPAWFAVNRSTAEVELVDSVDGLEGTHYWIDARIYRMSILLHGQEDDDERWSTPRDRIMAWRYQVDHECDPYNEIKDGGGIDDITRITLGEGPGLTIDAATGLWKLTVEVGVPSLLFNFPPDQFWLFVNTLVTEGQENLTDALYWGSLRQLGDGSVSAVAVDQTDCTAMPVPRPAAYNYFRNVRPTVSALPPGYTWRSCFLPSALVPGLAQPLSLDTVAMESNAPAPDYDWTQDSDGNPWTNADGSQVRGVPVVKDFRLVLQGPAGPVDCTTPPTP